MFVSAVAGVFIPIVLEKINVDPAVASGPINFYFKRPVCSTDIFWNCNV
ncbi:MAG: hypothetical protein ACOX1L_08650 [Erysipelotrichaceae bacterium]